MSWMQRLYDTYEQATQLDLPQEARIPPIRHTIQNAHINIVLNEKAEFVSAKVLKKFPIVLPATEASEARANVDAPHGLADKIQYVAKDYAQWGGGKKPFFESYFKQLDTWCKVGAPRKVEIVRDYVSQGKVLTDLIEKSAIFEAASAHTMLTNWPEDRGEPPEIFGSLPKEGGVIEPGSALVCWSVEIFNDREKDTWKDAELWESWIRFQSYQESMTSLCLVSGQESSVARLHPSKLRHSGDKAKLISANDQDGMTFRGRFVESAEAATVGSDITQKAHNALRWLVTRQGIRNGDQVTVAWAISGKPILNPISDWCIDDEPSPSRAGEVKDENAIDNRNDLGHLIAEKLKLKLKGYQQALKATEQLSLLVLDSATPGRMSVAYYREFLPDEYFKHLNAWYEEFAWYQRITKELEQTGTTKKIKKTVWVEVPPGPLAIAQAAYGKTLSDDLKKQVFSTVLTCIAEGLPFPHVLMQATVTRVSNPLAFEAWEWERNLGVACALYRGFYARHLNSNNPTSRRKYTMDIEENIGRSYSFGRLLAIADKVESLALTVQEKNRPTTAMRLMQRFSANPATTWKNIEEALHPYFMRIQSNYPPLVNAYKDLIGQEMEKILQVGKFNNDALDGEYLLGYHLQRRWFEQHQFKKGAWIGKNAAEQPDTADSDE
jgi:CRISPR-associated protein Csd1